jgi:hypothetical protein
VTCGNAPSRPAWERIGDEGLPRLPLMMSKIMKFSSGDRLAVT